MKRTEIRALIKEYLADNDVKKITSQVADGLVEYLGGKFPNERFGNLYSIDCEFFDFFTPSAYISGEIKRCDPIEVNHVIDSISFSIDNNLRVMVWERDAFALTLNMNNLSEDDLTDIMHIDVSRKIDIHNTFMRIPEKDRGKLSSLIPDSMALSLFGDDVPPYAFYQYDGFFYHTTDRGVGNLGGGLGFGGFIKKKGTIAEIGNNVVSIGEHAFDGCKNLTEVHLSGNVHYVGKHAFSNIPGLKIYCSALSKPASWDDEWCDGLCQVVFKE